MKKFSKFLAVLVTFGFLICAPILSTPVSAGLFDNAKGEACKGATLDSSSGCDSKAPDKLSKTIDDIVNVVSAIVGVVAVIMIIINGFRFITSSGDSATINSAKNGILFALAGLIIVAVAQIIVRFVLNRIAP